MSEKLATNAPSFVVEPEMLVLGNEETKFYKNIGHTPHQMEVSFIFLDWTWMSTIGLFSISFSNNRIIVSYLSLLSGSYRFKVYLRFLHSIRKRDIWRCWVATYLHTRRNENKWAKLSLQWITFHQWGCSYNRK